MLRIAQSREPNRPGPPRQRPHRRRSPRRLFHALGPRHGVGDGRARPHGPPRRGPRRAARLFQRPADRQDARPGQRRRLSNLGRPLFRRRRRGALLHPGRRDQHRVRRLGRGAVGARRISAQIRRPRPAARRHPPRPAVRERARLHRRAAAGQHRALRRRPDRRRRHLDLGGAAEGREAFRFLDRDGDRRPARVRRGARPPATSPRAAAPCSRRPLLERGFDAAFIRGGKLRGTLEPGSRTISTARSSRSSTSAWSATPPSSATRSSGWSC